MADDERSDEERAERRRSRALTPAQRLSEQRAQEQQRLATIKTALASGDIWSVRTMFNKGNHSTGYGYLPGVEQLPGFAQAQKLWESTAGEERDVRRLLTSPKMLAENAARAARSASGAQSSSAKALQDVQAAQRRLGMPVGNYEISKGDPNTLRAMQGLEPLSRNQMAGKSPMPTGGGFNTQSSNPFDDPMWDTGGTGIGGSNTGGGFPTPTGTGGSSARVPVGGNSSSDDPYGAFQTAYKGSAQEKAYGPMDQDKLNSNEFLQQMPNDLFRLLPSGRLEGFSSQRLAKLPNEDIQELIRFNPNLIGQFGADFWQKRGFSNDFMNGEVIPHLNRTDQKGLAAEITAARNAAQPTQNNPQPGGGGTGAGWETPTPSSPTPPGGRMTGDTRTYPNAYGGGNVGTRPFETPIMQQPGNVNYQGSASSIYGQFTGTGGPGANIANYQPRDVFGRDQQQMQPQGGYQMMGYPQQGMDGTSQPFLQGGYQTQSTSSPGSTRYGMLSPGAHPEGQEGPHDPDNPNDPPPPKAPPPGYVQVGSHWGIVGIKGTDGEGKPIPEYGEIPDYGPDRSPGAGAGQQDTPLDYANLDLQAELGRARQALEEAKFNEQKAMDARDFQAAEYWRREGQRAAKEAQDLEYGHRTADRALEAELGYAGSRRADTQVGLQRAGLMGYDEYGNATMGREAQASEQTRANLLAGSTMGMSAADIRLRELGLGEQQRQFDTTTEMSWRQNPASFADKIWNTRSAGTGGGFQQPQATLGGGGQGGLFQDNGALTFGGIQQAGVQSPGIAAMTSGGQMGAYRPAGGVPMVSGQMLNQLNPAERQQWDAMLLSTGNDPASYEQQRQQLVGPAVRSGAGGFARPRGY